MTRAAVDVLAKRGHHVLVKAPPGIGKTTALKSVIATPRLWQALTVIAVPTHALAAQLTDDIKGWARELQAATLGRYPSLVRHHKGGTQPGMCLDATFGAMADDVERVGGSPRRSVCPKCPLYATCKWIKQADDEQNGVIVTSHAALKHMKFPKHDDVLVVIDEGAESTFIGEKRGGEVVVGSHAQIATLIRDLLAFENVAIAVSRRSARRWGTSAALCTRVVP